MNNSRNLASASGHSEETEPQQLNSVSTPSVAARVLVVEDEPEILEPLAHSLHKAGYVVLRAEDGLSACRSIGSDNPDLVLLDIMLPDLDGWEVCKLLRQHPDPSVAGIPVIMLTALNSPHDKYRGLELGADAFLPKPYAIREVLLQAGNLIRRRRQTLDLENRIKALNSQQNRTVELHHLLFHELRNQLFILNGYTALLHKGTDTGNTQTCREAIYRSSNHLQTLAEEVLLIRQVEDGGLALQSEAFDADQLIDVLMSIMTNSAEAMPQGGTFAMVAPPNPYRCPPGPYERISMVAHMLKNMNPTAKILVADPKENFSIDTVGLTAGVPDENVRAARRTAMEYGRLNGSR